MDVCYGVNNRRDVFLCGAGYHDMQGRPALVVSLDGTHHHFEARYAAHYLAEFQYRFNRRYEWAAMLQRLLQPTALPGPRPIQRSSVA